VRWSRISLSLSALSACLLSGCAISTTPIRNSAATPVPHERIFSVAYETPEAGDAHIIVKRDGGLYGYACDFTVRINGSLLAVLRPAERIDLYLKPGSYILGASQGCGQSAVVEIEAQVQAGDIKTYRLAVDGQFGESGTFRFMPTESD